MQRVASGEFNPAYERCLELRNNPARKIWGIRKQELEDLKAENGELLERLAELDGLLAESQAGAGASTGDGAAPVREGMVPRSSYDRLKAEKEELEKAHAKRLQRLKEVGIIFLVSKILITNFRLFIRSLHTSLKSFSKQSTPFSVGESNSTNPAPTSVSQACMRPRARMVSPSNSQVPKDILVRCR